MWKLFIESGLWPTYLFELIAAVAGFWYLIKTKTRSPEEQFLPYFLIFIFLLDLFGLLYAMYGYLYDFRYLEFIKDTAFVKHYWVSNFLVIFLTTGYIYFYLLVLKGKGIKTLLKILFLVFLLVSIYAFVKSGFLKQLIPIHTFSEVFLFVLLLHLIFWKFCNQIGLRIFIKNLLFMFP